MGRILKKHGKDPMAKITALYKRRHTVLSTHEIIKRKQNVGDVSKQHENEFLVFVFVMA